LDKDPIEEFIERLPFFKEFSASERVKLVHTSGIFEKFKEGEVIISEGELSAAVFVILTGKIEIQKKSKVDVKENHISLQEPENISIAELKAGSIFGEISLISHRPRNTSAMASSNQVVVMKITKEIIEKLTLEIQKKFQSQLIQTLVERLDEMNEKFIKLKTSILKN
jgi:CRP-like cAMP-binding protein